MRDTFYLRVLFLVTLVVFVLIVLVWQGSNKGPAVDLQNTNNIPIIEATADGPNITRIPKILHQYWDDEIIPTEFVEGVKSLIRDNGGPDWQYYFWTPHTARQLIQDKYPGFLDTYDNYPEFHKNRIYMAYPVLLVDGDIRMNLSGASVLPQVTDNLSRADAVRYIFLYEYGGAYFDLDTVSVKPLESFIQQHVCAFVQEPDEHLLVYNVDYLLSNSAMLCRARHNIFSHMVNKLPDFLKKKKCRNAYDCTGPSVLTEMFMSYKRNPNDYIDIVPTDLFQDKYFIRMRGPQIRKICEKEFETLNTYRKTICKTWKKRGMDARNISKNAITYHMYQYSQRSGPWKSITFNSENNIKKIVPNLKMYKVHFT